MTPMASPGFPEPTAFLPVRSMVVSRTAEYRDDESWRRSASDGKAAGPMYFLLRGQGNLQEAERFQFTRTAQGACVDRAEATGRDHVGELRLGVAVVTGDQDGGGYLAGGAGR